MISFFLGLHKRCGSEKPHSNYASSGRYLTFRYYNTDTTNNNYFNMIFTAFHKGKNYMPFFTEKRVMELHNL